MAIQSGHVAGHQLHLLAAVFAQQIQELADGLLVTPGCAHRQPAGVVTDHYRDRGIRWPLRTEISSTPRRVRSPNRSRWAWALGSDPRAEESSPTGAPVDSQSTQRPPCCIVCDRQPGAPGPRKLRVKPKRHGEPTGTAATNPRWRRAVDPRRVGPPKAERRGEIRTLATACGPQHAGHSPGSAAGNADSDPCSGGSADGPDTTQHIVRSRRTRPARSPFRRNPEQLLPYPERGARSPPFLFASVPTVRSRNR